MDLETRRKKQQALMVQMVERQVRTRAQQLYETRGQVGGQDLQDWFQAEAEILENSVLAPLYRRLKGKDRETKSSRGLETSKSVPCESVS